MKTHLFSFLSHWLLIFFIICVVGCNSSATLLEPTNVVDTNNTPETLTVTPVVATSIVITLTSTPMATSTYTPSPTNTSLPPTATVTPSPTLAPIPTLTILQEASLVQELMATNGGCQFPCWWGIQLGESLESIGEIFINIGLDWWRVSVSDFGDGGERGYIKLGYFDPTTSSYHLGVSMDFYTINEAVQFIEVSAERPLQQYGEEELIRDWEQYTLSSILQKYGQPPYVYLIPQNVTDSGSPNYVLVLYYPELGFKFSYQPHEVLASDTQTEFCPDLQHMRQISLSLYNPEYVDIWSHYLLPPALSSEMVGDFEQWTWEKQTGMDLDTFYETYRDPNNLGCIQVN